MVRIHKIRLIRRDEAGRERDHVELLRVEGKDPWSQANETLLTWSYDVLRGGQVCPIEFAAFFMDGVKYHGVYQLTHWSAGMPDLAGHVKDVIAVKAGHVRPPFMPRRVFAWIMGLSLRESDHFAKLGEEYQIGESAAG